MKKALGILGGMGPQATIDLQQKILNLTEALSDQEHLRVYVDNHPQIPDRIGAVLDNAPSPVPAMQESLDKLVAMGAACIAMPCVSAHYFLPQLVVPERVVFLDMLQIMALACAKRYAGLKAGILCSEATARCRLPSSYLELCSVSHFYPRAQEQQILGRLILDVKAKTDLTALAVNLRPIAAEMAGRGADYFVLACTELPIIVKFEPLPYLCLDATTELARAAVLCCADKPVES